MAIFCHVFGVTAIRLVPPLKNGPHMALLSRNLNWRNLRWAYMHPRAIDHDEAKEEGCSVPLWVQMLFARKPLSILGKGGCCQCAWTWWAGSARPRRIELASREYNLARMSKSMRIELASWEYNLARVRPGWGWKCWPATRPTCPSLVDKWRVSGILSPGHMARVQDMQPTPVYILGIRGRGETQEDKCQEKAFRVLSQALLTPITMWGNEQEQPLNEQQPHIPMWNLFLQKCISFVSAFVWCHFFGFPLLLTNSRKHSSIYSCH